VSAEFLTADLAAPHGFFTRRGGVSTGPYASLNCSLSGSDARDSVLENRARAARAIGAAPENLLGLTQTHSAICTQVTAHWQAGSGPQADAMVTDRPGLALGIVTADCAPVLFVDSTAGVIGAAHAGWRGALAGILEATIDGMVAHGARPDHIAAAIGPCIQARSYEVTADLREPLLAQDPANAACFAAGRDPGHWQFDLPAYCLSRLRRAGLTQVSSLGPDTLSDETRFFSHRRRTLAGGGAIGHQISIIRCPT
jgi:YfiH family protein